MSANGHPPAMPLSGAALAIYAEGLRSQRNTLEALVAQQAAEIQRLREELTRRLAAERVA